MSGFPLARVYDRRQMMVYRRDEHARRWWRGWGRNFVTPFVHEVGFAGEGDRFVYELSHGSSPLRPDVTLWGVTLRRLAGWEAVNDDEAIALSDVFDSEAEARARLEVIL